MSVKTSGPFEGFAFLNKPAGLTSAAALDRLKRELSRAAADGRDGRQVLTGEIDVQPGGSKSKQTPSKSGQDKLTPAGGRPKRPKVKIGHTGTLDSFATGLLICPVGRATIFSTVLLQSDKVYSAEFCFGTATDTYDPLGEVTGTMPPDELSAALNSARFKASLQAAMQQLSGRYAQTPPVFSAKKVGGKRASDRIRAGQKVELKAKEVTVRFLGYGWSSPGTMWAQLKVSSGTYIRALARDLGELTGVPCHVSRLHRSEVDTTGVIMATSGTGSWDECHVFGSGKEGGEDRLTLTAPGNFAFVPGYRLIQPYFAHYELPDSYLPGLKNGKLPPSGALNECFAFQMDSGAEFGPNQGEAHNPRSPTTGFSDHSSQDALVWSGRGKLLMWIQWTPVRPNASPGSRTYNLRKNFYGV